ncbi:MAG: glutathione S-transferase C-terminal domain-containing protein [Flavimaricola sp.]|nr:glutathione S-transferase C-terminal domain-containing protein [Flavimaricola sp.]
MGQMLDGLWVDDAALGAIRADGSWTRAPSVIRHQIGEGAEFPPVPGRYRLYAAWNCPWAHRVLLTRALLGLGDAIPVSYVAPARTDQGWVFDRATGYTDDLLGKAALHEVYAAGDPDYTGRVTVPLVYDTVTGTLVSNESADLVRMLPRAFAGVARRPLDLYPLALRSEIDRWNDKIHAKVNNGVYRTGFAESQSAYDSAVYEVFATLDAIEERLSQSPYLAGDQLTEADVRLFPTLAGFDVAYYIAFKCCRRRITDYPHLWRYARGLYALPGVADTVRFDIYRRGYFSRSDKRNPLGIVPTAPVIDWSL